MTSPEHLRAGAALWSLRAALRLLYQREAAEDRAIADERAAAADPIKSPIWGTRQAHGGHGDPVSDALLTLTTPRRVNPFGVLAEEIGDQLREVARHLPAGGPDPLGRIEAALPAMSKTAALAVWRLADRVDGRIRRVLREPADRRWIPRARCPWCDAVSLMMRLAPPASVRVVQCTTCDGAWTWAEMTRRGGAA